MTNKTVTKKKAEPKIEEETAIEIVEEEAGAIELASAEDLAAFGMNEEIDSSDIEMPEIVLFQNQNEDKVGEGHGKGTWVSTVTKEALTDEDRIIPLHVQPSTLVWDEKAKRDGIEWPIFTAKRPESIPAAIRNSTETVEIEGEIRPRYAIDIGYDIYCMLNSEPFPYRIKAYRTSKKAAKQLNIVLMGRLGAGKGPGIFKLGNIKREDTKAGRKITYYNPRFIQTAEALTAQQVRIALKLLPVVRTPPEYGWNVDDHEAMEPGDRKIAADRSTATVDTVAVEIDGDDIPF